MLGQLRDRTTARGALAALAFVALALKIVFPPGFMPGTSLAEPIIVCSGQASTMPMMSMAHGDHGKPIKAPHQGDDHPCPFAGHGASLMTFDLRGADIAGTIAISADVVGVAYLAPGRGMAAPPPPSHAPPALRA